MNNTGNSWISIKAYFQVNGVKVSQPKEPTKEEMNWLELSKPSDRRVFRAFNFSKVAIGPEELDKIPLSTPERPYCECPTPKYCVIVRGNSEDMVYCHNCHHMRLVRDNDIRIR